MFTIIKKKRETLVCCHLLKGGTFTVKNTWQYQGL